MGCCTPSSEKQAGKRFYLSWICFIDACARTVRVAMRGSLRFKEFAWRIDDPGGNDNRHTSLERRDGHMRPAEPVEVEQDAHNVAVNLRIFSRALTDLCIAVYGTRRAWRIEAISKFPHPDRRVSADFSSPLSLHGSALRVRTPERCVLRGALGHPGCIRGPRFTTDAPPRQNVEEGLRRSMW